jgi:hypothetical protein
MRINGRSSCPTDTDRLGNILDDHARPKRTYPAAGAALAEKTGLNDLLFHPLHIGNHAVLGGLPGHLHTTLTIDTGASNATNGHPLSLHVKSSRGLVIGQSK